MKKTISFLLILVGVAGVLWVSQAWTGWSGKHLDPNIARFNTDAENLILGIQQYKEFTGSYPTGNNISIAKALLGQNDRKILILAVRHAQINDKGEILDPWGTPLQFYFSHNEVMIRSAGPNKAWEDSAVPNADDLYRCAGIDKK
jgi:hypothetical protein